MMMVGDELEIMITGKSQNFGFGRKSGFYIFVPDTNRGDHVKVKITRVEKNVAYAEHLSNVRPTQVNEEDDDDENYPDDVLEQYE